MSSAAPRSDLADLLLQVASGHPLPADGMVTIVPRAAGATAAVLAFTGHHVIAADVEPEWVHSRLPEGDQSAPTSTVFLAALAEHLGCRIGTLDVSLVATGEPGPPGSDLVEFPPNGDHPRVARSLRWRGDVRTFVTPGNDALLILGRGLAGRWEAAFEVDSAAQGRGIGRALAAAARRLVPTGSPVYLQVAPGNASSLRAVLSTGLYRPIGAEVLYSDPD